MQLQIPKDEAINILKQRLQELSSYNFNSKVWKDRTILDLKQIFGSLSEQWLQVSSIYFDTAIISQKAEKLREGKKAAEGLLISYIDFIEQYSKINLQRARIKEEGFEQKYYGLLAEYNERGQELIKLMDEHSALLDENSGLIDQVSEAQQENQRMSDETIQLNNITLKKLWSAIQNLPTIQVITIISILLALLGASFTIGQLLERTNANNESFELKIENKELKNDNQKLQDQIDSQSGTIKMKADSINSFQKLIQLQADSINKLKTAKSKK